MPRLKLESRQPSKDDTGRHSQLENLRGHQHKSAIALASIHLHPLLTTVQKPVIPQETETPSYDIWLHKGIHCPALSFDTERIFKWNLPFPVMLHWIFLIKNKILFINIFFFIFLKQSCQQESLVQNKGQISTYFLQPNSKYQTRKSGITGTLCSMQQ